jgi:V/A-type H+-transporting ATPase subunit I
MVMAHTFNGALGTDPGIFATILIALFGHVVNVSLCLMGGVVHGLRLNFLEWFHYCFEGGGKIFNPLKLNQRM